MKFCLPTFFDSEIGKWGDNQYQIQVVVQCQVVNLPSNWEGILTLQNKYNKYKIKHTKILRQ